MSTTTILSPPQALVTEHIGVQGIPSLNHNESSANVGNDLLIRRILPLEVYDHSHDAPKIISLEAAATVPVPELSKWQTFLLITTLSGITFASSMSTGLITIGLPVIAADLSLVENLLLW